MITFPSGNDIENRIKEGKEGFPKWLQTDEFVQMVGQVFAEKLANQKMWSFDAEKKFKQIIKNDLFLESHKEDRKDIYRCVKKALLTNRKSQ